VFRGNLRLPAGVRGRLTGSSCGITISYLTAARSASRRFTATAGMCASAKSHVEKAHAWFRKAGTGPHARLLHSRVRHLTAFAAGMSDLEAPQFALRLHRPIPLGCRRFCAGYFLADPMEPVDGNVTITWFTLRCGDHGAGGLLGLAKAAGASPCEISDTPPPRV